MERKEVYIPQMHLHSFRITCKQDGDIPRKGKRGRKTGQKDWRVLASTLNLPGGWEANISTCFS